MAVSHMPNLRRAVTSAGLLDNGVPGVGSLHGMMIAISLPASHRANRSVS